MLLLNLFKLKYNINLVWIVFKIRVKYAMNTETGEAVAIKVLDKEKIQRQNMGSQIKKEISIMKMIRNRHVVALKEVLASRTKVIHKPRLSIRVFIVRANVDCLFLSADFYCVRVSDWW